MGAVVGLTLAGCVYRAAGGQLLCNKGEKTPRFTVGNTTTSMKSQATTDVKKALASATKIPDKDNKIVLDEIG